MALFAELASFCVRDFSKENEDLSNKNGGKKTILVGPWGPEEGGYEWSFNEDGDAIIKRIEIYSDKIIDSLTVKYELDGEDDYAKFGGDGGSLSGEIDLNYPGEYLTGISGTYRQWDWNEETAVSSLKFLTNLNEYGPFGVEEGSPFNLPLEGGMILGFHGRMNAYLKAIGVYMKVA